MAASPTPIAEGSGWPCWQPAMVGSSAWFAASATPYLPLVLVGYRLFCARTCAHNAPVSGDITEREGPTLAHPELPVHTSHRRSQSEGGLALPHTLVHSRALQGSISTPDPQAAVSLGPPLGPLLNPRAAGAACQPPALTWYLHLCQPRLPWNAQRPTPWEASWEGGRGRSQAPSASPTRLPGSAGVLGRGGGGLCPHGF